jgi:predicted HTH domain antitoxin
MKLAHWLLDEIAKQWEIQPERVSQALLRALETDPELRWAIVVGAYLDEQISLAKAAELLGIDRWTLQEEFQMRGIPLRQGAASMEELYAEIQVWNAIPPQNASEEPRMMSAGYRAPVHRLDEFVR